MEKRRLDLFVSIIILVVYYGMNGGGLSLERIVGEYLGIEIIEVEIWLVWVIRNLFIKKGNIGVESDLRVKMKRLVLEMLSLGSLCDVLVEVFENRGWKFVSF